MKNDVISMKNGANNTEKANKPLRRTFTLGGALAWFGVFLTILVLGAHFFRADNSAAMLAMAGILVFHASREAWKTYVVGLFLAWGALEWLLTAHFLALLRMQLGEPWMRAGAILGTVAALTALAAVATLAKAGRRRNRDLSLAPAAAGEITAPAISGVLSPRRQSRTFEDLSVTKTAAFCAVFLALYALRAVKPDILLLERFFPFWGGIQIFLLAWYAGYIAGKLGDPRKSRTSRRKIWFIFTLVFFGQLALGLSGLAGPALSGTPHIPVPAFVLFAPAYRGDYSMMFFLVPVAVLLAGSAWCSMLCYFGSIEAMAAARGPMRQAPPLLQAAIRHGRLVALVAGLGLAFVLRFSGASVQSALVFAGLFAACSLILMLLASRRYTGMVHCTALCPLGLAINLLAKLSPWRIRIDKERCDGCGTCEKVCAYRAISPEHRQRGEAGLTCSLCRDCVGVCPHKAVFLKNFLLPAYMANHVFTVMVVVLHVVFLATARPL